jgi:nucleoside phosphorylase
MFKNNIKWFGQVKQHVHNSKVIVMGICYCFNSKQHFGKIKTISGTSQNDWFAGAFQSTWVGIFFWQGQETTWKKYD